MLKVFSVALLFAVVIGAPTAPVWAARHSHVTAVPRKQSLEPNQAVLNAEVLLDRAGASPGVIDGRDGENFANALHAFQQAGGLSVGPLDQATLARLQQSSNVAALTQYTIQPEDLKGPFAPQIPQDFMEMSR
jgi:peptidoglycan hydrolase-like protein with peptidoglycan-binding domain